MRRFVALYVMIYVPVLYDVTSFSVITLYYTGWFSWFCFRVWFRLLWFGLFVAGGLAVCLCFSWASVGVGLECMVRLFWDLVFMFAILVS